jgi:hypothetical protein
MRQRTYRRLNAGICLAASLRVAPVPSDSIEVSWVRLVRTCRLSAGQRERGAVLSACLTGWPAASRTAQASLWASTFPGVLTATSTARSVSG